MTNCVGPRPPLLRALGPNDPPETVEIAGRLCERVEIFKHDSWAATARYKGMGRDVVCKFNRIQPIFCLPTRWLGRLLAQREALAMQHLAGVPGIPINCGPIRAGGRVLENAVGHTYISGTPLGCGKRPDDEFFLRLRATLEAVHQRNVAYVDLHKRENILVGDDGRPHLLDFQVCFGLWSPAWTSNRLGQSLLRIGQGTDWFNFGKHVRTQRPDQWELLSDRLIATPPWWIRVHRFFAVPLRKARRTLLTWMRVRDRKGDAASEVFTEHALRKNDRKAA